MENAALIAAATAEIERPAFGVTEQFLEVHEVAYQAGKPEVAGVTIEADTNSATVYFSVKDEVFHLAVYLDTKPEIQVKWIDTEGRVLRM